MHQHQKLFRASVPWLSENCCWSCDLVPISPVPQPAVIGVLGPRPQPDKYVDVSRYLWTASSSLIIPTNNSPPQSRNRPKQRYVGFVLIWRGFCCPSGQPRRTVRPSCHSFRERRLRRRRELAGCSGPSWSLACLNLGRPFRKCYLKTWWWSSPKFRSVQTKA